MTVMRRVLRAVGLIGLAAAAGSCGDVARQGRSPVFLVIDLIEVASGSTSQPTLHAAPLLSDVITKGSIFDDVAAVTLRISPKDIGSGTTATIPSSNNEVTITRYHVEYVRADGRNTPGVDVPYPFDGAVTGTIPASGNLTIGFEIVRHVAKVETPLVQLTNDLSIINTICNITFYGHDRVGNAVSATGSVTVNFGNFADPS
jgi:hypothetical protein